MDGHDGFNSLSGRSVDGFAVYHLALVAKVIFGLGGIDLPVIGLGIDEDRSGSSMRDAVGGCNEREIADKDLVTGIDSACDQRSMKGGGSVDASHSVTCFGHIGEVLFKLIHVAPNTADPSGIETVFDVFPFVPRDVGNRKGDELVKLIVF